MSRIDELLRERRAFNAGIAKAALCLEEISDGGQVTFLLEELGVTEGEFRAADEVIRIEHFGRDADDLVHLLPPQLKTVK